MCVFDYFFSVKILKSFYKYLYKKTVFFENVEKIFYLFKKNIDRCKDIVFSPDKNSKKDA